MGFSTDSSTKKIKKLTPKQEKFVEGIVSGKNPSEAYKEAYDTKQTPKEISVDAQKQLKKPNIHLAIQERKAKIEEELKYTVKDSFLNLESAQSKAMEDGNINAYIKAEELKGRLLGLYTEKKEVDVNAKSIQVIFDEKCKGL